MPLDDFFAKKEKKKAKKKQNPQDLIEKLAKDVEKLKEQDGEANSDATKPSVNLGDDEWEVIDEEKDIEVQNVRMGNLELAPIEDSTRPPTKETVDKGNEESEDSKKVWAPKAPEPKDEQEEKPQPPAEPEPPKLYVPRCFRQDGSHGFAPPKPNVSSVTDFPTLDAAKSAEPAAKIKAPEIKPAHDDDDNAGWSQAGAPQRPRAQDTLSNAVSSNSSVYRPPALRPGGSFPPSTAGRFAPLPECRNPRPKESMTNCFDGPPIRDRFDGFSARGNTVSDLQSWSRGSTIDTPKTFTTGPFGGSPFGGKIPSPSRSSYAHAEYSAQNNDGWARIVNVKTFKDSDRDKHEFELVQTNRFAGFEESS